MSTREEIVACARTFIDTPFHHQGRLKGVGIDCVGVPIKVGHETGLTTFDVTGYSPQPDPALFRRLCKENLDEISFAELLPADMVSMYFEAEQHLAIVTSIDPMMVVHASRKAGRCIEHPLDAFWRAKVRTCWRYRGVED